MNVITFKGYYLNKCTNWWLAFSAIVGIIVFLMSNFTFENRWIFISVFLFAGLNVVMYLNRLEPKFLKLDNENFEITYFTRSFAKKQALYSKNEVKVLKEFDKLTLSNDTGVIAKIRKKALYAKDWTTLENYIR